MTPSPTSVLILASASPRRRQLLRQAGIRFQARRSDFNEGSPAGDPAAFARAASAGKARAVARTLRQTAWVLAADTVVARGKQVFGKPRSRTHARRMLELLAGRSHEVLTAVTLLHTPSGREHAWVERTRVWFRRLERGEIEAYLARGEWRDKAGGYGIQGRAGAFVERVEGCYFNVVGLPLAKVTELLRRERIGL